MPSPAASPQELPTNAVSPEQHQEELAAGNRIEQVISSYHEEERERVALLMERATARLARAENALTAIEATMSQEGYRSDDRWDYLARLGRARTALETTQQELYQIREAVELRREIMDAIERTRDLARTIQRQFPEEAASDTGERVLGARAYDADLAKLRDIRRRLQKTDSASLPHQHLEAADRLRNRIQQLEQLQPEQGEDQRHQDTLTALRDGLAEIESAMPPSGTRRAKKEAVRSPEQRLAQLAADVQRLYGKPAEKLNVFDITTRRATMALMGTLDHEEDPYPLWAQLREQIGSLDTEEANEEDRDDTDLHGGPLPASAKREAERQRLKPPRRMRVA